MKFLSKPGIFLLALIINLTIFLAVPMIQVLFRTVELPKKKEKQLVERELDVTLPRQQELQKKEIKKIRQPSQPSQSMPSLSRNFRLDLSVAGEGVAVGAGNEKGIGGPGGPGVMTYNPGETDSDAKLMGKPSPPKVPLRAKRENVEGFAVVSFVVNEQGFPVEVNLLSEDPKGYGFGKEAVQYVRRLKFKPAMVQNVPVRQIWKQTIDFTLN